MAPTNTWASDAIADRFVIALPGDIAPGAYELRVGFYNPDTQIRLPLTVGSMGGPDYVSLGQVEVR